MPRYPGPCHERMGLTPVVLFIWCRQWMMDGSRADFGSEWTGLLLNQIIRHAKKDKASEMQSLECTTTQISPSCERCSILVGIVLVDTTELRLAGTGCIDWFIWYNQINLTRKKILLYCVYTWNPGGWANIRIYLWRARYQLYRRRFCI